MSKKQSVQSHNLRLVGIFCAIVFFLIIVSFAVRIFTLFQSSLYDGSHRFTLAIYPQELGLEHKSQIPVRVVSLDPVTKSMTLVTIKPAHLLHENKYPMDKVGSYLKVPIDGYIELKDKKNEDPALWKTTDIQTPKQFAQFIKDVMFHQRSYHSDITFIDFVRMYMFSNSLSSNSLTQLQIEEKYDDLLLDKKLEDLFIDDTLLSEKKSIEIINGTNILGLGNRLARVISTIGGNVVSVKTSVDAVENTQVEYVGEPSYTIEKLGNYLKVTPLQTEKRQIADVIITIGSDNEKPNGF